MPRPRKYTNRSEAQKVYRQTEKGKATEKKYQSSEKAKKIKRDWWRDRYAKKPKDRRQHFIDTYGDIEVALRLLDKREKFVVINLNGLDGSEPMTLEAIGVELFLTGSRIQQIYKDAEKKLIPLKKAISEDSEPEK